MTYAVQLPGVEIARIEHELVASCAQASMPSMIAASPNWRSRSTRSTRLSDRAARYGGEVGREHGLAGTALRREDRDHVTAILVDVVRRGDGPSLGLANREHEPTPASAEGRARRRRRPQSGVDERPRRAHWTRRSTGASVRRRIFATWAVSRGCRAAHPHPIVDARRPRETGRRGCGAISSIVVPEPATSMPESSASSPATMSSDPARNSRQRDALGAGRVSGSRCSSSAACDTLVAGRQRPRRPAAS